MRRKLITGPRLIGLLLLLALGTAIFFALRKPAIEVELGTVSRGSVAVDVTDLGETRVSNLFVVSAPATGRLTRVPEVKCVAISVEYASRWACSVERRLLRWRS